MNDQISQYSNVAQDGHHQVLKTRILIHTDTSHNWKYLMNSTLLQSTKDLIFQNQKEMPLNH